MKYPIIITLTILLGCTDKNPTESYDSLSSAIIHGILTKDLRNSPVLVKSKNNPDNIGYILRSSDQFMQTIRIEFGVSDTAEIRKMLENSSFIDTTEKTNANISYISEIAPGDSSRMSALSVNGVFLIDEFFMLPTKDGNKCIVYLHRVKGGSEVAVLEKKNNKWQITSTQTEFLE
jgi:hypothetical protein